MKSRVFSFPAFALAAVVAIAGIGLEVSNSDTPTITNSADSVTAGPRIGDRNKDGLEKGTVLKKHDVLQKTDTLCKSSDLGSGF